MKKVVNVQRDPFLMKSQSSWPIQELKLPWWPTSIRKARETQDNMSSADGFSRGLL